MANIRLLLRLAAIAASSRSTRGFYDRVSPFYDLFFTDHLSHVWTMVATLREGFPERRVDVLDLACGTGALSRRLEEQGFSVTGLDFSFASLSRLKDSSRTIRLVQADAAMLPFGDASFDVVACMGAWRHFPEPQLVLDEIRRVLRPDGAFFVGYFPPKLGGVLSVPSSTLGRAIVSLYDCLMRFLKYNDRTDQEFERQTLGMVDLAFAKYRVVESEKGKYLIFAESPRQIP